MFDVVKANSLKTVRPGDFSPSRHISLRDLFFPRCLPSHKSSVWIFFQNWSRMNMFQLIGILLFVAKNRWCSLSDETRFFMRQILRLFLDQHFQDQDCDFFSPKLMRLIPGLDFETQILRPIPILKKMVIVSIPTQLSQISMLRGAWKRLVCPQKPSFKVISLQDRVALTH